jgi:tetratricopeptide (TPR) repeat protein
MDPIIVKSDRLFISYRRSDAQSYGRAVYEVLTDILPSENVFFDQETIPPGVNFADFLQKWVGECDILLALIGPGWIDAMTEIGSRRLDNSDDLVRLELRKALERGIPLIPVLLDGASMPDVSKLPGDLAGLIWQNAVSIRARSITEDMVRLLTKIGIISTAAGDTYNKAKVGDPDAMCVLGSYYQYNYSLPGSTKRAEEWYDLATKVGYPRHWVQAGLFFWENGRYDKGTYEKGTRLLQRAYDADNEQWSALASSLRDREPAKALKLWKKHGASLLTEPYHMERFAEMLAEAGSIDGKNYILARRLCVRALHLRHEPAYNCHEFAFKRILDRCDQEIARMGMTRRFFYMLTR